MRGPWGHSFGPVDLDIAEGGVTVIAAPPSRGRDALMLAVRGRMRTTGGTIRIFGSTDPRGAFSQASACLIDKIDRIKQSVGVRDLITEKLRWNAPWYRLIRPATQEDLVRVCRPTFGDEIELPPLHEHVDRLAGLQLVMLRIALANHPRRPLLVIGGIEALGGDHDRRIVYERLVELGREQTIVVADADGARGIDGIRQVIEFPYLTTGGKPPAKGPVLR